MSCDILVSTYAADLQLLWLNKKTSPIARVTFSWTHRLVIRTVIPNELSFIMKFEYRAFGEAYLSYTKNEKMYVRTTSLRIIDQQEKYSFEVQIYIAVDNNPLIAIPYLRYTFRPN